MKNYVILGVSEASEQVWFAPRSSAIPQLFTEEEAVRKLEEQRRRWPKLRFQIVVLRLGETTEFEFPKHTPSPLRWTGKKV